MDRRKLLHARARSDYPSRKGWRVVNRQPTSCRLRKEKPPAAVAQLEVVDPDDPDPIRAVMAAFGRLMISWQDPPGLELVLVLPDAKQWLDAAGLLTVRVQRNLNLRVVSVDLTTRPAWVRTHDLWGYTWGEGLSSADFEM